jgi:hypothetical protein
LQRGESCAIAPLNTQKWIKEVAYIAAGNINGAAGVDDATLTKGLGISWFTMVAIMIGRASGAWCTGLLTWDRVTWRRLGLQLASSVTPRSSSSSWNAGMPV